jgi:hypothetical protein
MSANGIELMDAAGSSEAGHQEQGQSQTPISGVEHRIRRFRSPSVTLALLPRAKRLIKVDLKQAWRPRASFHAKAGTAFAWKDAPYQKLTASDVNPISRPRL